MPPAIGALSVVAVVAFDGTSLLGWKETVVGSIVDALMIGLANKGLPLVGVEFSQQLIAPRPHHRARGGHQPLEPVTAGRGSRRGVPR